MKNARDYIGIPRDPYLNLKSSKEPGHFLYTLKDFFSGDIFKWIYHNLWVRKRYPYPSKITSKPFSLTNVKLGVVADWGSGTQQAEYVGQCIANKNTDFTLHLGDVYYSGTKKELEFSYGAGNGDTGLWPRGKLGSFALAGNHEMFSSGNDYYNMITAKHTGWGFMGEGQEAPVFCIKTPYWCILGLDTGYDSLKQGILPIHINPDNANLKLQPAVIDWLTNVVKIQTETRNIVVLTHHQYITAFGGEIEFVGPAAQLKALTSKEVIWIWGHEHRFSVYDKFQLDDNHITAYGRCIGHGGMPDEHTTKRALITSKAKSRNLIGYDFRVAETFDMGDNKLDVGYNGYAVLETSNQHLYITYYTAYKDSAGNEKENVAYSEEWLSTSNGIAQLTSQNTSLTLI